MNKVVVTGASGFIGKALIQTLLKAYTQVYAVVRNSDKLADLADFPGLTVIEAGFDDYGNLPERIGTEVDAFYHLAWDGYGSHTNDPMIQFKNVTYSINAMDAAIRMQAKAFIFTGSSHEFQKKPLAQGGEWALCSVYGAAKSAFKGIGRAMAFQSGIRFNSTVFSHVFGVGDHNRRSANSIIGKLLGGESPALIQGDFLYDWTYIDDVVAGLLCIGDHGKNLKDYYVGSKVLLPFREIVTTVRDTIAPDCKLCFGGYPDDSIIDYSMTDLDSLHKDTGFCATCDFKESVQKTAQWVTDFL